MNIQLLEDRIAIEPEEGDSITKGGIYLPDSAAQKRETSIGKVLAVGPGNFEAVIAASSVGKTRSPMNVSVGQRVVISKYAGNVVELDGKEITIVRQIDVQAILPPKAEAKK